MIKTMEEDFFLKNINAGKVFEIIERADYAVLYTIRQMAGKQEDPVYLSDLAEKMELPLQNASKAITQLEAHGYVTWSMDEKRERTYVALTEKAKNKMEEQRERLMDAYQKISEEIPEDDIKTTIQTLSTIRSLFAEING